MNAILGKWADVVLARPRMLLALLTALLASATYVSSQIRFEDGMRQVFQSEHPAFEQFEAFSARVAQPDGDLLVLADSEAPFTGEQLQRLRDFALDGQLVDGIAFGASPFSAQRYDPASGELRSVIDDTVDLTENPAAIMADLRDNSFAGIPYTGPENRRMVFLFTMADAQADQEANWPVLDDLEQLAAKAEADSGLKMTVTGLVPMRRAIVDNVAREQVMLNVVGGVIGTLIALFLFRSVWVGALNGVAPTFALLLTVGAFGLLGISLNVITNLVTVLILVLGMADSIHMTHELRRKLATGMDIKPALKAMLVEIGPPSILTTLTTIFAFASLFLSDSRLLDAFAFAGIVGMICVLVALFIVHPLVFLLAWNLAPVRRAFLTSAPREWGYVAQVQRFSAFLVRRSRAVVGVSAAVLVLSVWQLLPLETDHRFREYLHDDDPLVVALDTIERISAPSLSFQMESRSSTEGSDILAPETLSDLAKAHARTAEAFPNHKVVSLQNLRQMTRSEDTSDEAAQLREMLEMVPDRLRRMLLPQDDRLLLTVLARDNHSAMVRAQGESLRAQFARLRLEHLSVGPPQGLLTMAATMSHAMIQELVTSFVVAALLCCLLIGVWYRRWSYGLASILPNLLPIMLVSGYLIVTGAQIQFTSALALIVAFGVAVDDTIHFLHRHHILRAQQPDASPQRLIVSTLDHVAPTLVTTSLVLAGGLSATLLSSIPTAVLYGCLSIAVFILAVLADLFVLPPALSLLERRGVRRSA